MFALAVRVLLYLIAVPLAAWPFVAVDPAAGTITIHLSDLAVAASGGGVIGGATFVWSRIAKMRGGAT